MILITGGGGFIGVNLADRLLHEGEDVVILDSLARPTAARNVDWLRGEHGARCRVLVADVRERDTLRRLVRQASFVYHLAAQVAVTTSLENPGLDFDVNCNGTLGLLEELRQLHKPPGMLFTSTNKVYGGLRDVPLHLHWNRYEPDSLSVARCGINEQQALDFQSPYGCSKGAADQYVLEYARSYGLPATVFRMSCIYGPHQFGTEDQGWVAHFVLRALRGEPVTVYGDGKQVRDILHIDDLVEAMLLARKQIGECARQAFNVGGGPNHTVSLLELLHLIRHVTQVPPKVLHAPWRMGDQRYYVSNTMAFEAVTGWKARVNVQQGVQTLHRWLEEVVRAGIREQAGAVAS